MKETEKQLRGTLQLFADSFLPALDCDGCTRVVACLLENKNIEFEIYSGDIYETKNLENKFPVHFWIITKNGVKFDFKTEKWLGVKYDKVSYNTKEKINKQDFLSIGGTRASILGTLLYYGVNAPIIITSSDCEDIK